jgi:hypothetical protein
MKRSLMVMVAYALVGCSGSVERDDRPTFTIDRTQPFRLEFGRGSGLDGLNTVKIDQTGRALLHRQKTEFRKDVTILSWEYATLQLSPEALADVLQAVESNHLMGLHRAYHKNIADGTQWVLWLKQGEREKSVYFDNYFPPAITAFAKQFDAILTRAGSDKVTWQPVPERESGQHERELWDSIKR